MHFKNLWTLSQFLMDDAVMSIVNSLDEIAKSAEVGV